MWLNLLFGTMNCLKYVSNTIKISYQRVESMQLYQYLHQLFLLNKAEKVPKRCCTFHRIFDSNCRQMWRQLSNWILCQVSYCGIIYIQNWTRKQLTRPHTQTAWYIAALGNVCMSLQAGIEFKKNLRVRFGRYGGLKLEYFWVVKSLKAKSFIRG